MSKPNSPNGQRQNFGTHGLKFLNTPLEWRWWFEQNLNQTDVWWKGQNFKGEKLSSLLHFGSWPTSKRNGRKYKKIDTMWNSDSYKCNRIENIFIMIYWVRRKYWNAFSKGCGAGMGQVMSMRFFTLLWNGV